MYVIVRTALRGKQLHTKKNSDLAVGVDLRLSYSGGTAADILSRAVRSSLGGRVVRGGKEIISQCLRSRLQTPWRLRRTGRILHLPSLTPSIAFRHLPPNCQFSYATEGALFISAQLSTDAISDFQKVWVLITLRASLSGTFLQTLPDLLTPLKGHSIFISAQLSTDAVSDLRKVWVLI